MQRVNLISAFRVHQWRPTVLVGNRRREELQLQSGAGKSKIQGQHINDSVFALHVCSKLIQQITRLATVC